MNVSVINGRVIDVALRNRWRQLQQANPALQSPYFCIEFTETVAQVCADVEVAVIEREGQPVAFFPYHRCPSDVAMPVGRFLSDYHGFICMPGFACDPIEVLRACSLVAWDFDHLIASQAFFAEYRQHMEPSPQIDLSRGYQAYAADRRTAGSEQIKKCGNMMRRLEREIGPLRFISHVSAPAALRQVLAWKSKQYREGAKRDLFEVAWVRDVIECIHATQTSPFAGTLSVLYAGGRMVAGHLGMRSATVWHYWFPSYDGEMAKYSPGLILLLKMAEHAPSLGLRVIDLGKGVSLYKERLMNASVPVASGSVELPSWLSFRRGARRKLRALVVNSPAVGPARRLIRWARGGSRHIKP